MMRDPISWFIAATVAAAFEIYYQPNVSMRAALRVSKGEEPESEASRVNRFPGRRFLFVLGRNFLIVIIALFGVRLFGWR